MGTLIRARSLRRFLVAAGALLLGFCSCSPVVPDKPARPAILSGTVRDPQGNGLPGYELILYPGFSATTDNSGQYRVRVLEGSYRLRVSPPGYLDSLPHVDAGTIRVRAPATRWDYSYGGFKVEGSVTGPTGAPLDSGYVDALGPSSPNNIYGFLRVPVVAGHYTVRLTRATYTISARPQYAVPRGIPTLTRSSVSISADTTLDFTLTGHAVTGVVTLGPGVPVDGATVLGYRRDQSSAVTQADGSYELYLPTGDYDWVVVPGPQHENVMNFRQAGPGITGPTTLNFDVSGVDWSGTVRLSGTGDPVPSVDVVVDRGSADQATSTTDATGHFELRVRPGSRHSLYAYSPTRTVNSVYLSGVLAGNDSTFDLMVSPPSP